jgi:DNA-directed RNA polymerase subunit alpha
VAVATAPNYGRFAIGPLEGGIGITLGNALRRILLSSLPGSAVTSVRIQNVYHEFSCIPNVREDVTEIVLNVKNIRLRSYSDRAVRLNLSKYGPGEVRAGDIDLPANVELVNPELVLATLDGAGARLEMELTVERGRGYVSFEAREGMQIGTIPVDAIFSPIPKVNYLVQPADANVLYPLPEADEEPVSSNGSEPATDLAGREQLLIEIWTDGTIDPGEALSLSAQYLAQHSSLISNFNKQAAAPGRELPGAIAIPPHLFEMPIEDLNLSMRTYNCLKRSGITKVGQVLRMERKELLGLRNFGEKSFDELHQALDTRDLIPPGTPLDLSGQPADGEGVEDGEGGEGEQILDDAEIGYGEYDAIDEPEAFMGAGDAGDDVSSAEIVELAGQSEGSAEASAGIYIEGEPASDGLDLSADPATTGEIGTEEAQPKSRSKKK